MKIKDVPFVLYAFSCILYNCTLMFLLSNLVFFDDWRACSVSASDANSINANLHRVTDVATDTENTSHLHNKTNQKSGAGTADVYVPSWFALHLWKRNINSCGKQLLEAFSGRCRGQIAQIQHVILVRCSCTKKGWSHQSGNPTKKRCMKTWTRWWLWMWHFRYLLVPLFFSFFLLLFLLFLRWF